MKIRNIALLQELSQWNPDGNFDRVSAMGMLMLLREDKLRLLGPQGVQMDKFDNSDNLANDEFFTKNFGDIPDVNQFRIYIMQTFRLCDCTSEMFVLYLRSLI